MSENIKIFSEKLSEKLSNKPDGRHRLLSYPKNAFPSCNVIISSAGVFLFSKDGVLTSSKKPSPLFFSYKGLELDQPMELFDHNGTKLSCEKECEFIVSKSPSGRWTICVDKNVYVALSSTSLYFSKTYFDWEFSFHSTNTKQVPNICCPYCFLDGFTEDELVQHWSLWHGNENEKLICPICILQKRPDSREKKGSDTWGFSEHLFQQHGEASRKKPENFKNPTWSFALIICQHPISKKFVLIEEGCGQGWWLPAGRVDQGEKFTQAAHRECLEEAGIEIVLKGILSFEYSPFRDGGGRQRMIFYAHPKDLDAPLKNRPDFESLRAVWVSFSEMEAAIKSRQIILRGNEPYHWFNSVEKGCIIHSLDLLNEK